MLRENDKEGPLIELNFLQSRSLMQSTVLAKRREQLKNWEQSEMNTASDQPRSQKDVHVKFNETDMFLSACLSGDIEEVREMLEKGVDINVASIDGVTALHQAAIDGNMEILTFLLSNGANINAQDNEGWTALHAGVCCGHFSIVKHLCEHGADLCIANYDKELAIDLAEDDSIRAYLESCLCSQNIDEESCRNQEFKKMMEDCSFWLRTGNFLDMPHPSTGASALHVAASKGYNRLIGMLIKAGATTNCRDFEGWTPLHAAAHWGERDACRILMENGANINDITYTGQSVLDVADKNISDYLDELQHKFNEIRYGAIASQQIQEKAPNKATSFEPSNISDSSISDSIKHQSDIMKEFQKDEENVEPQLQFNNAVDAPKIIPISESKDRSASVASSVNSSSTITYTTATTSSSQKDASIDNESIGTNISSRDSSQLRDVCNSREFSSASHPSQFSTSASTSLYSSDQDVQFTLSTPLDHKQEIQMLDETNQSLSCFEIENTENNLLENNRDKSKNLSSLNETELLSTDESHPENNEQSQKQKLKERVQISATPVSSPPVVMSPASVRQFWATKQHRTTNSSTENECVESKPIEEKNTTISVNSVTEHKQRYQRSRNRFLALMTPLQRTGKQEEQVKRNEHSLSETSSLSSSTSKKVSSNTSTSDNKSNPSIGPITLKNDHLKTMLQNKSNSKPTSSNASVLSQQQQYRLMLGQMHSIPSSTSLSSSNNSTEKTSDFVLPTSNGITSIKKVETPRQLAPLAQFEQDIIDDNFQQIITESSPNVTLRKNKIYEQRFNIPSNQLKATPPTQPIDAKESESERKAKSKLKRQSRRSTQGVTQEQLNELQQARASHRQGSSVRCVVEHHFPHNLSRHQINNHDFEAAIDSENDRFSISSSNSSMATSMKKTSQNISQLNNGNSNPENVDYRIMYERERAECSKLRTRVQELENELEQVRQLGAISHARAYYNQRITPKDAHATQNLCNSSSMLSNKSESQNIIHDHDQHVLQEQRVHHAQSPEQIAQLKMDNEKLKNENLALIRVLNKLSNT